MIHSTQEPEVWYHLTDRARFRLDPKYEPEDNSLSIEDRSGQPGIYLGKSVERWVNGYGYWRPFVVEFEVDPTLKDDPGNVGRWGGEIFVPAESFHRLRIKRVIPIDAWARETYGDFGWVEAWKGQEFDTGNPIELAKVGFSSRPINPPKNYRYTGPDVREMSRAEVARHKKDMRAFRKFRMTGAASRTLGDPRPPQEDVAVFQSGQTWDPEQPYTNLLGVSVDPHPSKGRGATPDTHNVNYTGFVVWMRPEDFLALVPPYEEHPSVHHFISHDFPTGHPIGPSVLYVRRFDGPHDNRTTMQVVSHDGRGRMMAQRLWRDKLMAAVGVRHALLLNEAEVPVYVYPVGERARHYTPEMLVGATIKAQKGAQPTRRMIRRVTLDQHNHGEAVPTTEQHHDQVRLTQHLIRSRVKPPTQQPSMDRSGVPSLDHIRTLDRSTRFPAWLSGEVIEPLVPEMRARGVSEVARSPRGFLTAFRRAGFDPNKLSAEWRDKRDNFVARHMAQVRKNGENLWNQGHPTNRHLALVAWAYSPDPRRIAGYALKSA